MLSLAIIKCPSMLSLAIIKCPIMYIMLNRVLQSTHKKLINKG